MAQPCLGLRSPGDERPGRPLPADGLDAGDRGPPGGRLPRAHHGRPAGFGVGDPALRRAARRGGVDLLRHLRIPALPALRRGPRRRGPVAARARVRLEAVPADRARLLGGADRHHGLAGPAGRVHLGRDPALLPARPGVRRRERLRRPHPGLVAVGGDRLLRVPSALGFFLRSPSGPRPGRAAAGGMADPRRCCSWRGWRGTSCRRPGGRRRVHAAAPPAPLVPRPLRGGHGARRGERRRAGARANALARAGDRSLARRWPGAWRWRPSWS